MKLGVRLASDDPVEGVGQTGRGQRSQAEALGREFPEIVDVGRQREGADLGQQLGIGEIPVLGPGLQYILRVVVAPAEELVLPVTEILERQVLAGPLAEA